MAKDFDGQGVGRGHQGPLAVGDTLAPADGVPALFVPGPAQWFALRVAAQREDQAEAWLRLRGVYAFHPVLMRRVRTKGRVRDYARRYLPGYVFARFPGTPVVHHVTACAFVTGALCAGGGWWGRLDPVDLQRLHAMRKIDAAAEATLKADRIRRRLGMLLKAGDTALFRTGPLAGQVCEVAELTADGGVIVRLSLFGGLHEAKSATSDLVPLRKAG